MGRCRRTEGISKMMYMTKRSMISITGQLEVFVHACHGGKTEIRSVDAGHGVHGSEDGEATAVNPPASGHVR